MLTSHGHFDFGEQPDLVSAVDEEGHCVMFSGACLPLGWPSAAAPVVLLITPCKGPGCLKCVCVCEIRGNVALTIIQLMKFKPSLCI